MDDKMNKEAGEKIVRALTERDEDALRLMEEKYAGYIFRIGMSILGDAERTEECVNDVYFAAWNSIPPHRPENLEGYLGKLMRNLALKRLKRDGAAKRGAGVERVSLDEAWLLPAVGEQGRDGCRSLLAAEKSEAIRRVLSQFLEGLDDVPRRIFLRRYWYMSTVAEIARDFAMTESNVKVTLFRLRSRLKECLDAEGIFGEV